VSIPIHAFVCFVATQPTCGGLCASPKKLKGNCKTTGTTKTTGTNGLSETPKATEPECIADSSCMHMYHAERAAATTVQVCLKGLDGRCEKQARRSNRRQQPAATNPPVTPLAAAGLKRRQLRSETKQRQRESKQASKQASAKEQQQSMAT